MNVSAPRAVLDEGAVYVGDAGHVFCGRHAGHSARYAGHDIRGQPVMAITPAAVSEFGLICERCEPQDGAA